MQAANETPMLELPAGEGPRSFASRYDACLVLTLINIMLWGTSQWYTGIGLYSLCLPALVYRKLRHSPWLWVGICLLFIHKILINWAWADNHKYVMTYWSSAIAISLAVDQRRRNEVIATNARLILGLSMLFATIWKAIAPEYMSGAFFEVLFLTDRRFDGTIALLTDLTYGELLENQMRLEYLRSGYMDWIEPQSQQLNSSELVRTIALIATWWTVLIEGAKGVLFLIPWNGKTIFLLRNIALLAFLFTTYIIAPVPGFGCSLACMGMATCLDRGDGWYRLYQLAFLLVILYWIGAEPLRQSLLT